MRDVEVDGVACTFFVMDTAGQSEYGYRFGNVIKLNNFVFAGRWWMPT